jgi:hypothetical protein
MAAPFRFNLAVDLAVPSLGPNPFSAISVRYGGIPAAKSYREPEAGRSQINMGY